MDPNVDLDRRSVFIESIFGAWSALRVERDVLPWRKTKDPWLTLIAEFMLSQTQVVRVAERFDAITKRFPTPQSCADASQAEVIALWVGLGYNRRAIALHQCAKIICERFGAKVPSDLDQLLELPGVGPYTARAVLAFAFGEPAGVVDTNINRVLVRVLTGSEVSAKQIQELADQLVEGQLSREWNLALMDFGSLVCRARSPQCTTCPLFHSQCRWRRNEQVSGSNLPDPASLAPLKGPRQSTFSGSDRQGRGRLVRRACLGPIANEILAETAGWPEDPERAERIAERLVAEGMLAKTRTGSYQLA